MIYAVAKCCMYPIVILRELMNTIFQALFEARIVHVSQKYIILSEE